MLPLKHKHIEAPLKVTHRSNKTERQAEVVTYLIDHKRNAYKRFKAEVRLYFAVGLTISLLLVIALFEWKSYDKPEDNLLASLDVNSEEVMDIPVTEQPPPPPKQLVQQPNIIEVTEEKIIEDIQVDFDIEITAEEAIEEVDTNIPIDEPEEEVAEEIFTVVEDQPRPQNGLQGFYDFVSQNIVYPQSAKRMHIEGKVFVQFVVNADGSLSDFTVLKGIGGGCDEEAVRVLKKAPKWVAGKQRGKPVRVRMVMPIYFVLK